MDIKENKYILLLLSAMTLLVYGEAALRNEFLPLWDDAVYVMANPAVKGFAFHNIYAAFTNFYAGNYAPIQILSYMLDYSLWGMNSSGFIFSNIILHTLNGLLLFVLLIRSGCNRAVSFASAVFFLLHPIQVESVVWVSQRKTVLSMLFFLLSFNFYLSYRNAVEPRMAGKNYILSVVCFGLAALCKSVVVIMPMVLWLYDQAYPDTTNIRHHLKDKIFYLILAIIGAILAYVSQSPLEAGGRTGYYGGTLYATMLTMLPVLLAYIAKIIWPVNLSLIYYMPIKTAIDTDVLFAAFVVALLGFVGWYLYNRKRELFAWYAFFYVGLLPVSQIVPIVTLMNDRYLYFPMIGAVVFVCLSVNYFVSQKQHIKIPIIVMGCLIAIVLSVLTYERANVWRSSFNMWSDVVKKNPYHVDAWRFLAYEYNRKGDIAGAYNVCLNALGFHPNEPVILKVAGSIFSAKGDLLSARKCLEELVRQTPYNVEFLYLLADNYLATGNNMQAGECYRKVLVIDPTSEQARKKLHELSQ